MRNGNISTATSRLVILSALCLVPAALCLTGCQETTASTQQTLSDKENQALKDPMDYNVGWTDPDISGGGLSDFHKDTFNKNLNDVLNP
jgi:hypothetical protein